MSLARRETEVASGIEALNNFLLEMRFSGTPDANVYRDSYGIEIEIIDLDTLVELCFHLPIHVPKYRHDIFASDNSSSIKGTLLLNDLGAGDMQELGAKIAIARMIMASQIPRDIEPRGNKDPIASICAAVLKMLKRFKGQK